MSSPSATPTERLTSQPSARTFRVEELVRLVRDGQVRIPEFQRGFRWGVTDVEALFDSLLRGFPVGSLLLWQRRNNPAQTVRLGDLTIHAPQSDAALWVVDGQQRVTSLVNAVHGDPEAASSTFAMVYDLQQRRVVRRSRGDEGLSVPLPVVFDLRRLLAWVQAHPELGDHIEALNDVATSLRDVQVPASIVVGADDAVLREIFDRTNNSGKRLSRAEVFTALSGQSSGASSALSLRSVAEAVEAATRFGRIDEDTVLRAVLACRRPDVTREIRGEFTGSGAAKAEFSDDDQRAYSRAQEALTAAVSFLQRDAGVPHFAFLSYRYLLVALTRYFAHFPSPHPRNRALLVRWTWVAALRGPGTFRGSATGAMRTLCSRIRPGHEHASVQELLGAVSEEHAPPLPSIARFKTNEAATRVVLCALWTLGPRSLSTGAVTTVDDLAVALDGQVTALDAVFSVVPRHRTTASRGAANRLIAIPDDAEAARSFLRGQPVLSSGAIDVEAVFDSHAINGEARAALARGDDDAFLAARARALELLVTRVAASRSGLGLEPTPPLDSLDYDEIDEGGTRDDALD